MESVGQRLKSAREGKQMSVADVAEATQIPPQTVSAMERDDFNAIPAPIYARGFIKLYAEYMGLDSTELINAYEAGRAPGVPQWKQRWAKTQKAGGAHRAPYPRGRVEPGAAGAELEPSDSRLPRESGPPLPVSSLRTAALRMRDAITKIAMEGRPDPAKIGSIIRSGAGVLMRKTSRIRTSGFRLSRETRRAIPIVVAAIVLLILTAWGLSRYRAGTRTGTFDPRILQEPPAPYID